MQLISNCKVCSLKNIQKIDDISLRGICEKCSVHSIAYSRYYSCNIPVEYWDTHMPDNPDDPQDFKGPKDIIKLYSKFIKDFTKAYVDGYTFCLAGTHGIGKSFALANILKKAAQKNYTCLYTTLIDTVSGLTLPSSDEKFSTKKELMTVDFLVIDEFDLRHVSSGENAVDLFGRTVDHILRTRLQNKLSTLLCTNSPKPTEGFTGPIKQSIESLMNKIPVVSVIGQDFRKSQRA